MNGLMVKLFGVLLLGGMASCGSTMKLTGNRVYSDSSEEFQNFENRAKMSHTEASELIRNSWKEEGQESPRVIGKVYLYGEKFFFEYEKPKIRGKVKLHGYFVNPVRRSVYFENKHHYAKVVE